MGKKIAVFFAGVGYHADKPLLYYARKLAKAQGYECCVPEYGELPTRIKGDAQKKQEAFIKARTAAFAQLTEIDFGAYDDTVFISKSLGGLVAAEYIKTAGIDAKHAVKQVIFTPVQEELSFSFQNSIVFHGTADGWCATEDLKKRCAEDQAELYLIENANHSLETENVLLDLQNMRDIMQKVQDYLL